MRKSITLLTLGLLATVPAGAEPPGLRWQKPVLVASGPAHQGPWRMNESDFDYVDDPTLALTRGGEAMVAWVDQARKDVFLQRYDAAGEAKLPAPVNVSRSSDVFSWLPRMVVSGSDPAGVYVLWQEIVFSGGSHGGDILFARSTDGGRSFDEPQNLSRDRAGSGKGRLTPESWHNGSLDLARAADGTLHAAWTDYEGSLWVARSTDDGQTFSEPLEIVSRGDGSPARGPSFALGDESTVYLAWSATRPGPGSIHLTRSDDGGVSFAPARVSYHGEQHADAPKLLVDATGMLHLFFALGADAELGNYRGYEVAHARLADWEEEITVPVVISRQSAAGHGAGFPSAAAGGDNRLYVMWDRFPRAWDRPHGLGYSISDDGGRSWSTPNEIPDGADPAGGINGSLQGLLMQKIAANQDGDVAVVTSTFRRNDVSQVRLLRADPLAERSRPRSTANAASSIFSPASSNTTVIWLPR